MYISNIIDKLFMELIFTERALVLQPAAGQPTRTAMQLAIGFPSKVGPQ